MSDSAVPSERRTARPSASRVAALLGANPGGRGSGSDAGLGQGMEMALTSGVFLVLGWLLDTWLGLFPVLSISLVLFATVGQGLKLWFVYNHRMAELERERQRQSTAHFERSEDES